MKCQPPITDSKLYLIVIWETLRVVLPEVNASAKVDERKSLLLPVNHCVRVPVSFGDTVTLMKAIVKKFHVSNINKKRDNSIPLKLELRGENLTNNLGCFYYQVQKTLAFEICVFQLTLELPRDTITNQTVESKNLYLHDLS